MLAIDAAAGMPLFWTAGEGPFVTGFSAVILWLSRPRHFPAK
jgi:hypothetical protein